MFVPKILVCLREGYTREMLGRDLLAGVVVGIVALPLALAFAIASGVPPERGLYTAIVAGFLISALGGSRVQIGGPTGAFVVIVYGIVAKYGYEGLVSCTIIAGVILIAMGLARLGSLIKFIPYPVITGFTSGIAIIIFSSQVKDFLGLKMGAVPVGFIEKWQAIGFHLPTFDGPTVLVSVGTLFIVVSWPRVSSLVPAPFVAMVLAIVAVQTFDLPVETIGSRFGSVPSMLPKPHFEPITLEHFRELIAPAVTIALLAAIESLLSAVVADGMIGSRHKSNIELVAQGIANIASPLFGGIPATGAIARTATNIKTGGRTPIAGLTHSVTLLLILVFFGKWAAMVPLASLAAILIVVSYHMSEWHAFRALLRSPKSDVAVLLLTFTLTIFVDLTVAVQVGLVAASLLFIRKMAEETFVAGVSDVLREKEEEDPAEISHIRRRSVVLAKLTIPAGVEVFEITGPLFFGAAEKIRDIILTLRKTPRVFILRMRRVPMIDATGLRALEHLQVELGRRGTILVVSESKRAVLRPIVRARLVRTIGRQNFAKTLQSALDRAREILDEKKSIQAEDAGHDPKRVPSS